METEAVNAERVWQETAEDLDRAHDYFLQEIEHVSKERNSVLERAQERDMAMQRAIEAEEQLQTWFEGAGDMQAINLQQERDAALERAMAAEEMIQSWQQKMDRMEQAWMEWRSQMEELQQQSEESKRELDDALGRADSAEKQVKEHETSIQSLSSIVDKLENSCLWWEAIADEMKAVKNVDDSVLESTDQRIESMDSAYRVLWEDRMRWKALAEAAIAEKDHLGDLLSTVQSDQKTSLEVREKEQYLRSVSFLQKQVEALKSRLENDDQTSIASSREQGMQSGSSQEEMEQVELLFRKENGEASQVRSMAFLQKQVEALKSRLENDDQTSIASSREQGTLSGSSQEEMEQVELLFRKENGEAAQKQANAQTEGAFREQVVCEELSEALVKENLLLSQRVKSAAELAAGEIEAAGVAVLEEVQSLYEDQEHTKAADNQETQDCHETLEQMQHQIGSLAAELDDVRAQLIELGTVCEQKTEEVEARETQIDAMQTDLQNAKDEINQLVSELEHRALALQLEAHLTKSAQDSLHSLNENMSELQKQNTAMGWALEAAQEKCTRQEEKILALEQACDEWRECTHSERAVADVLREALKDSSHANSLDLSLVLQSQALGSSLLELRKQLDVLISQKSSAEALCDATVLERDANGFEDTEHRKYLIGLHDEAETLLRAFSTCTSELETVMGGLQVQFGRYEQQTIKTHGELEKAHEDLKLRQLEYEEHRLQCMANAEAAAQWQIGSREAIISLESKLRECEAGKLELQARMNEDHDDKLMWKSVAEKAERENAEFHEMQEQLRAWLAELAQEVVECKDIAQETLNVQSESDKIKSELQAELDECQEERRLVQAKADQSEAIEASLRETHEELRSRLVELEQEIAEWKSKSEQLQAELDAYQQEKLQLTTEKEQTHSTLRQFEDDASTWREEAGQLQQLNFELRESNSQLQARLIDCEADLSLWARKAEAVGQEKADLAEQLGALRSNMQKIQEAVPVALSLTLECDYDAMLADSCDVVAFNESLITDIHTALGVPKSTVQVLCHQRGSIVAEIVLRSWDNGEGTILAGQELATRLQDLLSSAGGPLRQSPLGCFVTKAEIHGPVAEAVVSVVDSTLQGAARRQDQWKLTERELLARIRECEQVRQSEKLTFEVQKNELNFLSEREDEYLHAISRAILELETSLDTLETQVHSRVQSEAYLQSALNSALSEAKITLKVKPEQHHHSTAVEELRKQCVQLQRESEAKQQQLVEVHLEMSTVQHKMDELSQGLSMSEAKSRGYEQRLLETKLAMRQQHERYRSDIQLLLAAVAKVEQAHEKLVVAIPKAASRQPHQPANLALGNHTIMHYVETPMKASPEFFTSEEIKNARSCVLMYSVLDSRRARHLQRQGIHKMRVWVGRQNCLRKVSAMLLKAFYEHTLFDFIIKWRNLKRRQQHRRRIGQKKVQDVTAPLRAMRLLADSFLWWWVLSNRQHRLRFCPEAVSPPPAHDTRFLTTTLPKFSPHVMTPRESLGAVASAGAAMTPRRHPDVGRS